MTSSSFKRILVKLSGEALIAEGSETTGIDPQACQKIASTLKNAYDQGTEIAIVIGGGNLFRGRTLTESMKIPKVRADEVGMMATMINGLILSQALQNLGCKTKVLSSWEVGNTIEPYSQRKAMQSLEEKKIVLFVGGAGHPYFTTDTAASLRALEIGAEAVLKATKVDGIYSADPKKDPNAKRYNTLSFKEALDQNLEVMDTTALSLCKENNLPIVVFNMYEKDNLLKVIQKQDCGTLVQGE